MIKYVKWRGQRLALIGLSASDFDKVYRTGYVGIPTYWCAERPGMYWPESRSNDAVEPEDEG